MRSFVVPDGRRILALVKWFTSSRQPMEFPQKA
jgi:hypothetical protein